ncbi:hypothetical protein [Candidatus Solirubrobacter pratensis]|uniref:hypothetical protein n=1 Tax=Candidatus Solirubrobacter pratensis TaxID=1298857 RepID=UPI0004272470|nr:hypothetical protein [Candidatus Solirubrobacter pratensis]
MRARVIDRDRQAGGPVRPAHPFPAQFADHATRPRLPRPIATILQKRIDVGAIGAVALSGSG